MHACMHACRHIHRPLSRETNGFALFHPPEQHESADFKTLTAAQPGKAPCSSWRQTVNTSGLVCALQCLLFAGIDKAQSDHCNSCKLSHRLFPYGRGRQPAHSPGSWNGAERLLHLQCCWLQRHRICEILFGSNLQPQWHALWSS